MSRFHIVLPQAMNLPEQARRAARREAPRHGIWQLATALDAIIHEPDAAPRLALDRVRALVAPPESLWTLGRRVRSVASPRDVVFCTSEAGGLQLAAGYGAREPRPRIAVFVHNIDRPRARLALRWWRMAEKIELFLASSKIQTEFLRDYLGLAAGRVQPIWDHTDTRFFTPGQASGAKRRPLIASIGLEQRDYGTLATATRDLDADVRITGFSQDAAATKKTFPKTPPDNMSSSFYEWSQLLQLYRDADVIVISCHPNRYAAGVQSLMEAAACGRPLVVTATAGLKDYLDDTVIAVPPGDAAAMRRAILATLADRPAAQARAARSHARAVHRYSMERYVADIGAALRSLV